MKDESLVTLRFSGHADDLNFEAPPQSYSHLTKAMHDARIADEIEGEIRDLYPELRPRVEINFSEGSIDWHGLVSLAGTLPSALVHLAHGPLAPFIATAHIFEFVKVIAEIINHVVGKHLRKAGAPRVVRPFHTIVVSHPPATHPTTIVNVAATSGWRSPAGVSQLLFGLAAILAAVAVLLVAMSYHGALLR
ncbi:MAG TPA: hypothetical protein VGG20_24820 [Thermoanaerobaculia bacterium]|jgi:hypothetical protein